MRRVGVPQRRGEQHDQDPGDLGGLIRAVERSPAGGRRYAAQDLQVRTGGQTRAVEDGQHHRHRDALLDSDH